MSNSSALPANCFIRPADQADRWVLQKLVLHLIWSEALGFDVRVIGYRLIKILLLGALVMLEAWCVKQLSSSGWQSVLMVLLFVTAVWAIASGLVLLLYIALIPTEPLFNWPTYYVVECQHLPVACAAVSYFGEFCVLYHVVVAPGWRRQGLASVLVEHLVKQAKPPIYLVCKPRLIPFYQQLGFESLPWHHLSRPLKTHFRDFAVDRRLSRVHWEIMAFSHEGTVSHRPQ
ncbi:MAG: GNAT family N-acetyltransferase [Leptolyngbyaceae cyanobacterium bins.349]|nr:GNAT family N-acetyltransferase [Leptolyngbyaceae cyanobacterium bins.349]